MFYSQVHDYIQVRVREPISSGNSPGRYRLAGDL